MVDSWPGTLPQKFQPDNYSEAVGDGLAEDTNDAGPPNSRPRTSAMPRPVSGTMQVTTAQIAVLRTFVETTLSRGALPFNFPGQSDASTWLVKFPKGGLPSWTSLGADWWTLKLNLLVLP